MMARGNVRLVWKHELGRGTPETLEIVEAARLLAEDMQDEAAKIDQRPFGGAAAFAMFRRTMHMFFELVFDFGADGLHLWSAERGADHEIISERADAAEIENRDAGSFLILRRFNSEADCLWEGF